VWELERRRCVSSSWRKYVVVSHDTETNGLDQFGTEEALMLIQASGIGVPVITSLAVPEPRFSAGNLLGDECMVDT
jgi:hypothetical protein